MLIILLAFALIRTLRGTPLLTPTDDPNAFPAVDPRDSDAFSHFGERAVSDIILSCFATIFACTWSAVHPNVPAPTDCWWTRFKRQVVTMVYALLAPEAITAWALRQRLAAGRIVNTYNTMIATYKRPDTSKPNSTLEKIRAAFCDSPLPPKLKDGQVPVWTLAHGFFVQMGGFILAEGGQPIQSLTFYGQRDEKKNIIWSIKDGIIDAPLTTAEDIKDRSKGDAISKTLIIFQTTWFIVQCIARWSNRLPVTELEIVTLGFAMLNGITYGLWWHKPQNVGRPVFLEIKRKPRESSNAMYEKPSSNEDPSPKPTTESGDSETEIQTTESSGTQVTSTQSGDSLETCTKEEAVFISTRTAPSKDSYLGRKIQQDNKRHASSQRSKLVYLIPLRLVEALLRPLAKLADYHFDDADSSTLRVPMFYSAIAENSAVYMSTTLIGVLFGLVHLIPSWFLDFASVEEMWLWRGSAIPITVAPLSLGLWPYARTQSYSFRGYVKSILIGVLPIYIISRIVLLTLSLTSLRALPAAALQTVDWTTFIPHI